MGTQDDKESHPNRPQDTPFKQQRLTAWQPILTPKVIIGTFLVIGVIFVVIGWVLNEASADVVEYRVRYDGFGDISPEQDSGRVLQLNDDMSEFEPSFEGCRVDDNFSFDNPIGDGVQKTNCFVEFQIDKAMEGTTYVYYELDNFYQNHRRYVSSRVDLQLRGEDASSLALCDPLERRSDLGDAPDGDGSKTLNPCGLIAYSLFNDTIGPPILVRNGEINEPRFTYDEIAWRTDVDEKFSNFPSAGGNSPLCTDESPLAPGFPQACYQYPNPESNYYLYEAYPFSINEKPYCQCDSQAVSQECIDNEGNQGDGCCTLMNAGLPTQYYDCGCANCPFPGKGTFGVEDEHFIVWMRTAGLPNFRKLYMKIEQDLEAGDVLRFPLKTAFPVGSFDGRKSIVISTISAYGGKNDFLGTAYIVVGSLCLVFGVAFLVKDLAYHRELGDPAALEWKKKA